MLNILKCATRPYRGGGRGIGSFQRSSAASVKVFSMRGLTQVPLASDEMLSPAVRYLIGTHKIADASVIEGSGPKNRLLKGDILKYLEELKASPVKRTERLQSVSRVRVTPVATTPPKPSYTDLPLDNKKMEEARELVESKQAIPHIYFTTDCRLPSLLLHQSTSVLQALMVKSTALALQRLPEANSIWREDGEVQCKDDVNISYHTVQAEHVTQKLILGANRLSLKETADILELESNTGSDNKEKGNISIYQSIGSGIKESTAILRPWQPISLYISSPHRGLKKVSVTLSGDSRVLSLELAAKWLQLLKSIVSESTLL